MTDWTRLLPRKQGTTDQNRVAYLVDFLMHRRGSKVSVNKAVKELSKLKPSATKLSSSPAA